MKQRILIAKQLIRIAEQITKQEEKKQQNVIKKVYKKIKKMLEIKSLFKHKIKNKIIEMVVSLIEQLYKEEMITEQELKELKLRLNGKKASSIKNAGKKGFIFLLLISLISLFMPIITFCNTVTADKQQSIETLLNSKIECTSFSRKNLKEIKKEIDETKDNKEKIKLQKSLYEDDAYDLQQCKNTDIVSVAINFLGDNEMFSYFFVYRTKTGTNEIIKPNKMSDNDYKKMLTIIAIFDKDNVTELRERVSNKMLQQFINFNKKLISQQTNIVITKEKDTLSNDLMEMSAYQEIKQNF